MSWVNDSNFPTPYDALPEERQTPVINCFNCGCGIFEDQEYYELIEGDYCKVCILDLRKVAML